ncbi:MAG: hypothetical protein ABIK73_08125 [candidate division WOR-3 bacterium]
MRKSEINKEIQRLDQARATVEVFARMADALFSCVSGSNSNNRRGRKMAKKGRNFKDK